MVLLFPPGRRQSRLLLAGYLEVNGYAPPGTAPRGANGAAPRARSVRRSARGLSRGQGGHQVRRVGRAEPGHRVPAGGRVVAGDGRVGPVVAGGHVVEVRAVALTERQAVQRGVDLAEAVAGDLGGN